MNTDERKISAAVAPTSKNARRVAFYGGSFDPLHNGHFAIAKAVTESLSLTEFVFVPAFRAPHKPAHTPASAFDRFAMLAIATADEPLLSVSPMELEVPERPYTFDTLSSLLGKFSAVEIFFVMGADSWADIRTWMKWEQVLTMTNHVVVTRPGYPIEFGHVGNEIGKRIVDLRAAAGGTSAKTDPAEPKIYITDAVRSNASASRIRTKIKERSAGWKADVPESVANYIEKYELYR